MASNGTGIRLTLAKPITVLGDKVTEISFRQMTAGDLYDLNVDVTGLKIGALLDLAAKLTGLTPEIMKTMSPQDGLAAVKIVGDFLGQSQETGGMF